MLMVMKFLLAAIRLLPWGMIRHTMTFLMLGVSCGRHWCLLLSSNALCDLVISTRWHRWHNVLLVHACISPMLLRLLYYLLTHSLLLIVCSSISTIRIKCLKKGQSGITMVLLTIHNACLILTPSANDHFVPQTIRFPMLCCLLLLNWVIFLLFGWAHQDVLLMIIVPKILEKLIVGWVIKLAIRMPIGFQSVNHFLRSRINWKHLILILSLLWFERHAIVRFRNSMMLLWLFGMICHQVIGHLLLNLLGMIVGTLT